MNLLKIIKLKSDQPGVVEEFFDPYFPMKDRLGKSIGFQVGIYEGVFEKENAYVPDNVVSYFSDKERNTTVVIIKDYEPLEK